MSHWREGHRTGLDALAAVTELLQRRRSRHPTAGLFEAADLQWWWGQRARVSDDHPQLFWFDDDGRTEAAIMVTAGSDRVQMDPMLMPGAPADLVALVVRRGLAHAAALGYEQVTLEVDPDDVVLRGVLEACGLDVEEEGVVEAWLEATARPPISPLADGYRLVSRAESADRPHHMISEARQHPDPEPRLRQTSLYRDDLDLVVLDDHDDVAAYGLLWNDPVTRTGLVEPMRTEDAHQRRGLARHVLTAGLDRLATAGAERIKICFEPDNPASSHLYVDVGFVPHRQTISYAGRCIGRCI
jgi:RimJ/RimL family protein N-acetyltransferase